MNCELATDAHRLKETEVRSQKSEDGERQMSEIGYQMSEGQEQETEARGRKTDVRRARARDRGRRTEDGGREGTDVRCQMSDVRRARARDRGQRSEDSRLRKATPSQGGRRSEFRSQRSEIGSQRSIGHRRTQTHTDISPADFAGQKWLSLREKAGGYYMVNAKGQGKGR